MYNRDDINGKFHCSQIERDWQEPAGISRIWIEIQGVENKLITVKQTANQAVTKMLKIPKKFSWEQGVRGSLNSPKKYKYYVNFKKLTYWF